MKKHLVASAAVLALAIPVAATADINYDYVELDFIMIDDDIDSDGPRLKGSFGITDNIYLFGSAALLSGDGSVDTDIISLGAGYRHGINEQLDLYAALAIEHVDVDVAGMSDDDTGFSIRLGARYQVIPQLELKGELQHTENDMFPDEDQTLIKLGAQYLVTPAIGILADYWVDTDSDDGADAILVGGRFNF